MGALDRASVELAARVAHKRRLVANLCRMLDPQPGSPGPAPAARADPDAAIPGGGNGHTDRSGHADPAAALSPRMRQTLDRLLAGDSEKEIASRFGRSRHTIHVYVKKLYQRYGVSSRGELFARFVRNPGNAGSDRHTGPHPLSPE